MFNFTKWEIHHCFPLVIILHHYIHSNIRLSKTVQFHQVENSPPFSAGHHSLPLHTLQHWTKKANKQTNKQKLFNFSKWEIHHCFLLVTNLHHYIQCNTGPNRKVQFHQVGNSPLFSAGHHSSPLHTMQHGTKQNSSISPSGKLTLYHHLNCNSGSSKTILVPLSGKFTSHCSLPSLKL